MPADNELDPLDRWLNQHFVTHMPAKRQEVLASERNSSFDEFLGEYYYTINQDSILDGTKILLAKNNSDLRRIISDGAIALVMTIEGSHVFFGNKVMGKMNNLRTRECDEPCRVEILGNIDSIRTNFSPRQLASKKLRSAHDGMPTTARCYR